MIKLPCNHLIFSEFMYWIWIQEQNPIIYQLTNYNYTPYTQLNISITTAKKLVAIAHNVCAFTFSICLKHGLVVYEDVQILITSPKDT